MTKDLKFIIERMDAYHNSILAKIDDNHKQSNKNDEKHEKLLNNIHGHTLITNGRVTKNEGDIKTIRKFSIGNAARDNPRTAFTTVLGIVSSFTALNWSKLKDFFGGG